MNAVNEEMFEQYAQNMLPLVRVKEANSAGIMPNGNLASAGQKYVAPPTLFERMFGRSAAPTDTVNPENATATVSQTPRVGGIFPDIAAGYRENRNTPISLNNFGQNDLGGGRKKGFAYRLGEGLGSLARIGESPLGRGLLVGGLVLGTGGGALPALAFGGATSMGNQQNRMRNQLYRNALEQQGIDTSNIRGYIGDDTFKNYSLANYRNRNLTLKNNLAILKDNTQRAKFILDALDKGYITPEEAQLAIAQYGISDIELQESNRTRQTDSNIILNDIQGQAAMTNAEANKTRAETTKALNDYIIGDTPVTGGMVKMQAPDGNIYNVPAHRVQEFVQVGGKVVR